ncbi:MAG TPA: ATP-grasp domain-containing protein, partial [bacterium]|nr:ATP-grasp domain-containing protein [bacterium]
KKRLGDEFMVQRLVGKDNEEYTVAAFGLGDGAAPAKFCLRRKLSREGATAKAVVTSCKNIENETDRLAELFKPVGPTNFQFRIHDGEPLLLEINPRISSSTSIRTAFGYNEAAMCVAYFLEDVVPGIPETRSGSAERFIDDVITYDSDHR